MVSRIRTTLGFALSIMLQERMPSWIAVRSHSVMKGILTTARTVEVKELG